MVTAQRASVGSHLDGCWEERLISKMWSVLSRPPFSRCTRWCYAGLDFAVPLNCTFGYLWLGFTTYLCFVRVLPISDIFYLGGSDEEKTRKAYCVISGLFSRVKVKVNVKYPGRFERLIFFSVFHRWRDLPSRRRRRNKQCEMISSRKRYRHLFRLVSPPTLPSRSERYPEQGGD